LRRPSRVSPIRAGDPHGEPAAIRTLYHSVESNLEVSAPQRNRRTRSRAVHKTTSDFGVARGSAVESSSSRGVNLHPRIVWNARAARVSGTAGVSRARRNAGTARPVTAARPRAVGHVFHAIAANVDYTVVGRGSPTARTSNSVAQPAAQPCRPLDGEYSLCESRLRFTLRPASAFTRFTNSLWHIAPIGAGRPGGYWPICPWTCG
jgi:hypothetical protein